MVVGAVWSTDESCSIHSKQRRFLFSPNVQDRSWLPSSLLFSEFRGLLLSVKWPGREPDDLLPPGAVPPLPHMPSWRAQGRIYLEKELRKDELHILYSSLHACARSLESRSTIRADGKRDVRQEAHSQF
jgi:hypothetical protein